MPEVEQIASDQTPTAQEASHKIDTWKPQTGITTSQGNPANEHKGTPRSAALKHHY